MRLNSQVPMRSKIILTALAALLTWFPLFFLKGDFYTDWINHKWLAGYFGEYFSQHRSWPVVINTSEVGGMAYPLFYGVLYYPVMGFFSHWIYPGFIMRVAFLWA